MWVKLMETKKSGVEEGYVLQDGTEEAKVQCSFPTNLNFLSSDVRYLKDPDKRNAIKAYVASMDNRFGLLEGMRRV